MRGLRDLAIQADDSEGAYDIELTSDQLIKHSYGVDFLPVSSGYFCHTDTEHIIRVQAVMRLHMLRQHWGSFEVNKGR
jgi:hypothetical protein